MSAGLMSHRYSYGPSVKYSEGGVRGHDRGRLTNAERWQKEKKGIKRSIVIENRDWAVEIESRK